MKKEHSMNSTHCYILNKLGTEVCIVNIDFTKKFLANIPNNETILLLIFSDINHENKKKKNACHLS